MLTRGTWSSGLWLDCFSVYCLLLGNFNYHSLLHQLQWLYCVPKSCSMIMKYLYGIVFCLCTFLCTCSLEAIKSSWLCLCWCLCFDSIRFYSICGCFVSRIRHWFPELIAGHTPLPCIDFIQSADLSMLYKVHIFILALVQFCGSQLAIYMILEMERTSDII